MGAGHWRRVRGEKWKTESEKGRNVVVERKERLHGCMLARQEELEDFRRLIERKEPRVE